MEDIDLDIELEEVDDMPEGDELMDVESLAARFAETLEMSDASERQAAIESFLELLSPESVAFVEESLNVVI